MLDRVLKFFREFVDFEKQSLDRSVETLSNHVGGVLLDVGCGDKPYEVVLGPRVAEYIGLEYKDTYFGSINRLKGRADVIYDGHEFPFQDRRFDTVLCTQVLEHADGPELMLAEIVRVLKPGGRLILTIPFVFRLHSEPYDYWRFTEYGLRWMIGKAGLSIEYLNYRCGFWKTIAQAINGHLICDVARLEKTLQSMGSHGYALASSDSPRYWLLPLVAPAVLIVALFARLLDRVDQDKSMTLGYVAIAIKPP